jgi:hypothetical protein
MKMLRIVGRMATVAREVSRRKRLDCRSADECNWTYHYIRAPVVDLVAAEGRRTGRGLRNESCTWEYQAGFSTLGW